VSIPTSTIVYTDGACQGNPGPGGWAWAVPDGDFRSGADPKTTNQRMELLAVLDVVTTVRTPLTIVSDSTYVVNCFKNRWWEGWIRKGWKNAQRQPVANQDLWMPLVDDYRADPDRLTFQWVKGHSGDPMNDLVDRLAVEAAARQEGRSGTGTPGDLGPPDRPRGASTGGASTGGASTGAAAPTSAAMAPADTLGAGHRLLVTGLRPPDLGGYEENLVAASVRRRLAEVLVAKAAMYPDLLVTSGLGLGAEQLAAEAAIEAGVPYTAVLAFSDQDRMWPARSRTRFAALMNAASDTVILDGKAPTDKQAAGRALARRDEWLATNADEAVVVWDEADPLVGRTVHALQRRLGEEQVWVLQP
jgi:ribonuclease HI